MHPFEQDNTPTNKQMVKLCREKNAIKIDDECHHLIMDETLRHDGLEYDPTRTWVAGEGDEDDTDIEDN